MAACRKAFPRGLLARSHLGLNNLIVIYDDNHISNQWGYNTLLQRNVAKRFEAYNWFVQKKAWKVMETTWPHLSAALAAAQQGSPSSLPHQAPDTHRLWKPQQQDSHDAHGSPLGEAGSQPHKETLRLDPEKRNFLFPRSMSVLEGN